MNSKITTAIAILTSLCMSCLGVALVLFMVRPVDDQARVAEVSEQEEQSTSNDEEPEQEITDTEKPEKEVTADKDIRQETETFGTEQEEPETETTAEENVPHNPMGEYKEPGPEPDPANIHSYLEQWEYLNITDDMRDYLIGLDNGQYNSAPIYKLIDFSLPENQKHTDYEQYIETISYTSDNNDCYVYPQMRTPEACDVLNQILADEGVDTCELRYWENISSPACQNNRYSVVVNGKCYDIYETWKFACGGYNKWDTDKYCK